MIGPQKGLLSHISYVYAYHYHQIDMNIYDEEKTTFTLSFGIFCYMKMTFGLKNVGTTY
jgi:hypothetical protein